MSYTANKRKKKMISYILPPIEAVKYSKIAVR